jgi:hypothetical protein
MAAPIPRHGRLVTERRMLTRGNERRACGDYHDMAARIRLVRRGSQVGAGAGAMSPIGT